MSRNCGGTSRPSPGIAPSDVGTFEFWLSIPIRGEFLCAIRSMTRAEISSY